MCNQDSMLFAMEEDLKNHFEKFAIYLNKLQKSSGVNPNPTPDHEHDLSVNWKLKYLLLFFFMFRI